MMRQPSADGLATDLALAGNLLSTYGGHSAATQV